MFSHQEKISILSEFPNIKLSYENITHNKVSNYDIVLAIPEGKKCFAWFTTYQEKNVCLIMELAENKQITHIKIMNAVFKSDMVFGTIFYGTVFYYSRNNFFTLEDVFYYKGSDVSRNSWLDKFELFNKIMSDDIKQASYNKNFIVFGLPILSNAVDELQNKLTHIKYKIKAIQFRSFNRSNQSLFIPFHNINNINNINQPIIEKTKPMHDKSIVDNFVVKIPKLEVPIHSYQNYKKRKEIVFNVKADVQNDIYHLYYKDDLSLQNYNVAFIPNYTTSVMMNKIFRNIKENINLDALEESDDEEEFQNEKEDRFVNLEKTYNMMCSYNYKFKKWTPLRLAETFEKLITKRELDML
jgi:hypothetical protein